MTQEEKILLIIKSHPEGVHPSTLAFEAKITQYNARINGIREMFGCECKNGFRCLADEHIINKRMLDGTTKFFYEKKQEPDWEAMRLEVITTRNKEELKIPKQLKIF